MRIKPMLCTVVSLAAVLMAASGVLAEKNPSASVGFVDMQQVVSGCNEYTSGMTDLQGQLQKYQGQLARIQQFGLLSDDERKEAETLSTTDKQTDAQKARLAELTANAQKYQDELKSLRQVASPDDTQKVRLNELSSRERKADDEQQTLYNSYSKDLNDKQQQLTASIQQKIDGAIITVGKEKSMSLVLDKAVVYYGGTDLTEEVLKVVNKK